jgi:hypothetical protein
MIRKSILALLLAATGVSAHAALSAGDIAIIGRINNATPDSFSFVALSNIAAGETIYFTDNGWTGSQFRGASATDGDGNENLTKWTAASTIAAGTIISSTSTDFTTSGAIAGTTSGAYNSLSMSQSGEQIYAFQGSASNPLFNPTTQLYVFDDTNAFENATNTNTGAIPTGLVSGVTAISLNQIVAGNFSVNASILSGPAQTKDQWLATFATAANWQAGASALPAGSILVTAVPEPKNYAMFLAGLGLMGVIARRRISR